MNYDTTPREIIWPQPQLQPWDLDNMKAIDVAFVGTSVIDAKVVLLSDTATMSAFVKENYYNPNYDDDDFLKFDAYALYMTATVRTGVSVGFCVDSSCWSIESYNGAFYYFTSFTLAFPCTASPYPYPDTDALASNANCVDDFGDYIGNGFDGCWNYDRVYYDASTTEIEVWKWLATEANRPAKGSEVEICMFEPQNNVLIKEFVLDFALVGLGISSVTAFFVGQLLF